jgi:hypothetical protein
METGVVTSGREFSRALKKHIGRHLAGLAATAALFAGFLLGSLRMVGLEGTRLWLQNEAGYGDSYVLYDVTHFKKTGVIYRDLSQPPYLPAQYSPLVYMMYAIPSENPSGNPFLGPHLVALAAFVACVAMAISLVRTLVPLRLAWLWGLVLLCSIRILDQWPLQLRGDFPAIFFNLAALRLLMSRSRYRAVLAGLCAGAALQFKFTYVAGIAACFLWLAFRKRWKDLAFFVPAAGSGRGRLSRAVHVNRSGRQRATNSVGATRAARDIRLAPASLVVAPSLRVALLCPPGGGRYTGRRQRQLFL